MMNARVVVTKAYKKERCVGRNAEKRAVGYAKTLSLNFGASPPLISRLPPVIFPPARTTRDYYYILRLVKFVLTKLTHGVILETRVSGCLRSRAIRAYCGF